MLKKSFLILGTTSSSGKSFMTTLLIRYFKRQGIRVAPFKAMNLSSRYRDMGAERKLAWSVYLQSLAAEVELDARMNPVYVRPLDQGMEVYLNGIKTYSCSYREYGSIFPLLKATARESYEKLAEDYEVIVMEGSGSPAEINCHDRDLANRFMAELATPCTVLVGDIYLGGVFASLHGTLELMPDAVRSTVKAFIINRYCGEADDLRPAIEYIESRHGIPCIGIIPIVQTSCRNLDDHQERQQYFHALDAVLDEQCCFDVIA